MIQIDSQDKNQLDLCKELRRALPINTVFIHKWLMPDVLIIIKLKSTITDLATYMFGDKMVKNLKSGVDLNLNLGLDLNLILGLDLDLNLDLWWGLT